MASKRAGTAASSEKIATSRTCNCPSLSPIVDARLMAMRRPINIINVVAGSRLATSRAAAKGGDRGSVFGPCPTSTSVVTAAMRNKTAIDPISSSLTILGVPSQRTALTQRGADALLSWSIEGDWTVAIRQLVPCKAWQEKHNRSFDYATGRISDAFRLSWFQPNHNRSAFFARYSD